MDDWVAHFWAWYTRHRKDLIIVWNFILAAGGWFWMLWLAQDLNNMGILIVVASTWIVFVVQPGEVK